MKRALILLVSYALIAACPITSSQGQNSSSAETKTAIFAGGCFWCIQPAFDKARGVITTAVGYCGGTEPNPTYEVVSSEKTGYRESIQITYDLAKISYDQLLDIYWREKSRGGFKGEACALGQVQQTDRDRNSAGDEILSG